MKLSIIVPAFNEGKLVEVARRAIVEMLSSELPTLQYEIIFVDDGSRDDTFFELSELAAEFPYVRVIKFVHNCGSHMAIRAGLEHAQGDIACFLACDLQDPPSVIPELLASLVEPTQIVWAVRNTRQDNLFSRLFSKVFFALARLLVSKDIPPSGASMFLLGSKALEAMRLYKERNLTLEGLFATMGFQQAYVKYERQARQLGKSKWTLAKRLNLFADFFVGYSYAVIRLMSYMGILTASLGLIYAFVVILNRIFFSTPVAGWTSLMVVMLLVGGIQMIMTGIIGEYLWRTLDESRNRPRYIIDTMLNNVE